MSTIPAGSLNQLDSPLTRCNSPLELLEQLIHLNDLSAGSRTPFFTFEGQQLLEKTYTDWCPEPGPRPNYDGFRRRLRYGDRLVKIFRQPAPFQTALLVAFERNHWTRSYLFDVLSDHSDTNEERSTRLQSTVKNLNRCLAPGTIRFRCARTSLGVRWEPAQEEF